MKREEFIGEVLRDPYAHMLVHMWTDAYAQGYEQALADHEVPHTVVPFSERRQAAGEALAKRQADATIALAQIGRLLGHAGTLPPTWRDQL